MVPDREHEIRRRAYALWESEGRPDGRECEHWAQAERECDEAEMQRKGGAVSPPSDGAHSRGSDTAAYLKRRKAGW